MDSCDALIVGGGPAGLCAAELISAAGWQTVLAERKPSAGRKFLVAVRGGLNLTHSEPVENFPARYDDAGERWSRLLAAFSPTDLRTWAEGLGVETFIGTSGRIFPMTKQAAPLLRRWVERLRQQGVSFRPRHALTGFRRGPEGGLQVAFTGPEGPLILRTQALVLALGGASWPQTGSDGGWVKLLTEADVGVTPLSPANCGYEVDWTPEFLARAEGLPLKNLVVRAGGVSVAGELLITRHGLEGGALYQLGQTLRTMQAPKIEIDLKPAFTLEQLLAKAGQMKGATNLLEQAARAWRLGTAAQALIAGNLAQEAEAVLLPDLAARVKALPLTLRGPRPIEEAISSAGGVKWEELDDDLMLQKWPGIFCAGEMIDWAAPTGGYLLQGCFSTANRAARGAQKFLQK